MTLDEIYESFIWDKSHTDEEYKAKIIVADCPKTRGKNGIELQDMV
ncbi:MAG: hypothetical protein MR935_00825 [Agathobaculum sp.]|nr:hypothetical protein [Agathobaculum sp.]MCI7124737.1 hypothetical protein [Agathobaculum sp.]MDY3712569.1 hypothetical protein [Agathobaculum sp.]